MTFDAETLEHYAVLGLSPGAPDSEFPRAEAIILREGDRSKIERMWLASGALNCRALEISLGEEPYSLKEACSQLNATEAIMRGRDSSMPTEGTFGDIVGTEKAIGAAYDRIRATRKVEPADNAALALLLRAEHTLRREGALNCLTMSRDNLPRALIEKALANLDSLIDAGKGWAEIYYEVLSEARDELGLNDVKDLQGHPYLAASSVDNMSPKDALRALMEHVNRHSQITRPETGVRRGYQLFIVGDEGFTITDYTGGRPDGSGNKRREVTTKVFAQNVQDVAVGYTKLGFLFRASVWLAGFSEHPIGNPSPEKIKTPIDRLFVEFPSPLEAHAAYNLFMRWFDDKKAQTAARQAATSKDDNEGLGIDWFEQPE